ncbi:hypothetical protein Tco_0925560 [Tanacetum coccineum]|uniref:Uncharacterized protein n=1 Tax=Tanacetum coccineum TaxID=301880 RepID=A0ABQ5D782_9ASTR
MAEKSFLEIQGTFLVKIRDNTFNGTIGENAVEDIENFLEVVRPPKIKGVSHDRFRLSVFPISLAWAISEWFKKDCIGSMTTWEDLVEKFVQKFYHLSYNNEEREADKDDNLDDIGEIFKIKGNLFFFETPLCKSFNEFNYLLKIDTLMQILTDSAMVENYPGCIFGRNYGANNARDTQDSQEHKKEHHDPSICQVRRFEMMKYSFDANDEYVTIKEHEHFDHSRTNIDACQAYRECFRIMDEGWLMTKAKEE